MRTRHSGFIILGMMLAAVSTAKGQDSTNIKIENDQPCAAQVRITQGGQQVKMVTLEAKEIVTLRVVLPNTEPIAAEVTRRGCGPATRTTIGPVEVARDSNVRISIMPTERLSYIALIRR